MEDMYREVILDHYKNPRFRGELDPADISYEDDNPLCGDNIRIDLKSTVKRGCSEYALEFPEYLSLIQI